MNPQHKLIIRSLFAILVALFVSQARLCAQSKNARVELVVGPSIMDTFHADSCAPRFVVYSDRTVLFRRMSDQGQVTFHRLTLSQESFLHLLRYADDAFLSPYFQAEEMNGTDALFSDLLVLTRCYVQGAIDVELYNASLDDFKYDGGKLSIRNLSGSLPRSYILLLSDISFIVQQLTSVAWVPNKDSSGVPTLFACRDFTAKAETRGPCPVCAKMKRELDAVSLSDYWHKFISKSAQERFNELKANKS